MLPSSMFYWVTCPYSYHNIYATFKLLLTCLSLSPLENKLPKDKVLRFIQCCFPSTRCSTCDTRQTQHVLLLNRVKCSLLPRAPTSESFFPCLLCYLRSMPLPDPDTRKRQNHVLLLSTSQKSFLKTPVHGDLSLLEKSTEPIT